MAYVVPFLTTLDGTRTAASAPQKTASNAFSWQCYSSLLTLLRLTSCVANESETTTSFYCGRTMITSTAVSAAARGIDSGCLPVPEERATRGGGKPRSHGTLVFVRCWKGDFTALLGLWAYFKFIPVETQYKKYVEACRLSPRKILARTAPGVPPLWRQRRNPRAFHHCLLQSNLSLL